MNQKINRSKPRIITIDGPAGAGKTTVSRALSQYLGCIYVDTGALYRGVAYEVSRCNVDLENDAELESMLQTLHLEFKVNSNELSLFSSGQDITQYIRTPEITMLASSVSAIPAVREKLLGIQRNIAEKNDAVFEGRDMGTVIFPHAEHKFFLFADLNVRALRRYNETDKKAQNLDEVETAMAHRDQSDASRKEAPLKPAEDAVEIDSTHLTLEEVVFEILNNIRQKKE